MLKVLIISEACETYGEDKKVHKNYLYSLTPSDHTI